MNKYRVYIYDQVISNSYNSFHIVLPSFAKSEIEASEFTFNSNNINANSKRLFRDIYTSIKSIIRTKDTSNILSFEASNTFYPFPHIYTGLESQPTYSGLGNRKQTPRRAWIAQVINTFSCFFNFRIQLYQNYQ